MKNIYCLFDSIADEMAVVFPASNLEHARQITRVSLQGKSGPVLDGLKLCLIADRLTCRDAISMNESFSVREVLEVGPPLGEGEKPE